MEQKFREKTSDVQWEVYSCTCKSLECAHFRVPEACGKTILNSRRWQTQPILKNYSVRNMRRRRVGCLNEPLPRSAAFYQIPSDYTKLRRRRARLIFTRPCSCLLVLSPLTCWWKLNRGPLKQCLGYFCGNSWDIHEPKLFFVLFLEGGGSENSFRGHSVRFEGK